MGFKLHYWPALTACWIFLTLTIPYLISALVGNVPPFFPYISDAGAKPPGSCVFGQMMNIAAILMAVTVYIRYRQVDFLTNCGSTDLSRKWNNVALWLGNIVALGISVVGNFQGDMEGSAFVITVHFVGAFTAFGVAAIYATIQLKITFALRSIYAKYPEYRVKPYISYLRLFLTIWLYILLLVTIICGIIASSKFTGNNRNWWTSEHEGFSVRLVSAFSEWLMVFVFMGYLSTVTNEFKLLEFKTISFGNTFMQQTESSSTPF